MIEGWPIDTGELTPEWTTLAALAAERFDMADACFNAYAASEPGLDRRGQGAYFIGGVAFYYSTALAHAVLSDRPLPNLAADKFAMTPQENGWLRYRAAANTAPADVPVGALVETVMAPLVPRIKEATRLSDAAQWRLVADNVASAFLYVGKHLGREAQGAELGLAIVRDPTWRFFNGHTGYYDVDGQCFLKRGGCCRYYTSDAGSYCATCILRPPEQHIAELRRRYIAA